MALERSDRLIEAISNRDSLMKLRASHYHSIPGGYLFILFIHRYLVIYGRAKPSPIKGWLGALGGSRGLSRKERYPSQFGHCADDPILIILE